MVLESCGSSHSRVLENSSKVGCIGHESPFGCGHNARGSCCDLNSKYLVVIFSTKKQEVHIMSMGFSFFEDIKLSFDGCTLKNHSMVIEGLIRDCGGNLINYFEPS